MAEKKTKKPLDLKARTLAFVLDDVEGWNPEPDKGEPLGDCLTAGGIPDEDKRQIFGVEESLNRLLNDIEDWAPSTGITLGPHLSQQVRPKTEGPFYTPSLDPDEDDDDDQGTSRVDMSGNEEYQQLVSSTRDSRVPQALVEPSDSPPDKEKEDTAKIAREQKEPPYEPRHSRPSAFPSLPPDPQGSSRPATAAFILVGICSMVGAALGTWAMLWFHGAEPGREPPVPSAFAAEETCRPGSTSQVAQGTVLPANSPGSVRATSPRAGSPTSSAGDAGALSPADGGHATSPDGDGAVTAADGGTATPIAADGGAVAPPAGDGGAEAPERVGALPKTLVLPITFRHNRAEPASVDWPALKRIAKSMVADRSTMFVLVGYPSTREKGWRLSFRRTRVTRDLIRSLGPSRRRFKNIRVRNNGDPRPGRQPKVVLHVIERSQ